MQSHQSRPGRIALPPAPQEPPRREFPLLATIAPVVGSLVMWAVTGSPFALVFAFLGPVVAIGSLIDSRRHGRRNARAEAGRYQRAIDALIAGIGPVHQVEREDLLAQVMQPHELLAAPERDPEWWRQSWRDPIFVCLGMGAVPSQVELEPLPPGASPEVQEAHARVRAEAGGLANAPILVDARDGIGIVGPLVPAAALARSLIAQLAFRLSPLDTGIRASAGDAFSWAQQLPHPRSEQAEDNRVEFHPISDATEPGSQRALCVIAESATLLPRECRVLIRLDGSGAAAVEREPSGRSVASFSPWFVSEVQASMLVERAAAGAAADGLAGTSGKLPDAVRLYELVAPVHDHSGLPAAFATGRNGAVVVDLVHDGPHAIVGGTTGSGKSELLVSWVLAMASACTPAEVNFLLVDFKGGSSFAAIRRLPHTVGLITDLDQASARRALLSLQAELRHRERVLAAFGARSLDELPSDDRMPRLVILVDEFAVVATEFPDLQAVFADLAARGRSLGIHLILCTQRPAGVIRDSVLANCSLRLSLRVNNPADSTAVIGSPAAASLPVNPQGRCLISVGGTQPIEVQVALAGADDAERVQTLHSGVAYSPRQPWCEPLPAIIRLESLPSCRESAGLAFGLTDLPEAQSQPAAEYDPARDGNLIVLGALGSGKTGTLDLLQRVAHRRGLKFARVPTDVEGAWDALCEAVASIERADAAETLYLIDDVDSMLARYPVEYQLELTELLVRLLREGPGSGIHTVLTTARAAAGIQSLLSLCDSRLLLRMPNRQEHVLAGGDGAQYEAELPPGAGSWRGHRVQVAMASGVGRATSLSPRSRREWPLGNGTEFAVVAAGAARIAESARQDWAAGEGNSCLHAVDLSRVEQPAAIDITVGVPGQVLFGDPSTWLSHWALFTAVRSSSPVVFARCSVADFRALTGIRQLPPPLGARSGAGWMLAVDGSITRVQLPEWFEARRTQG